MSYGFSVVKDADGIRLSDVSEGALAQIPDGIFNVSGHVPADGTSPVATLAVTLSSIPPANGFAQFIGSAAASYITR